MSGFGAAADQSMPLALWGWLTGTSGGGGGEQRREGSEEASRGQDCGPVAGVEYALSMIPLIGRS